MMYFGMVLFGIYVLCVAIAFAKHHNDAYRKRHLEQQERNYDRYGSY